MKLVNCIIKAAWFLCTVMTPFWPPLDRMVLRVKRTTSMERGTDGKVMGSITAEEIDRVALMLGPFKSEVLALYGERTTAKEKVVVRKLVDGMRKMRSVKTAYDIKMESVQKRAFSWLARRLRIIRRPLTEHLERRYHAATAAGAARGITKAIYC